jgi:phospholipase C
MTVLHEKYKDKVIFVLVNQNGEYYCNTKPNTTPHIEYAVHFAEKSFADSYLSYFAEGFKVIKVKREESITYKEVE